MNPTDSILEEALAHAGIGSALHGADSEITLTQSEIDQLLEKAYNQGLKDGFSVGLALAAHALERVA